MLKKFFTNCFKQQIDIKTEQIVKELNEYIEDERTRNKTVEDLVRAKRQSLRKTKSFIDNKLIIKEVEKELMMPTIKRKLTKFRSKDFDSEVKQAVSIFNSSQHIPKMGTVPK